MPRVRSQKAAKDYPTHGIMKGQTYYKWKFFKGPAMMSATFPRRAQLTRSHFLSTIYDIEDRSIPGLRDSHYRDPDGLKGDLETIKDELQELADDAENSLYNMPESLQQGPTGELLQGRVDGVQEMIDSLDGIIDNLPDLPDEKDDPGAFDMAEPLRGEFDSVEDFDEAIAEWDEARDEHEDEVTAFEDYESELDELDNAIAEAYDEAEAVQYEYE